jgi:hypothetical protein
VPTSDFAPVQAGSTRELVGKLADQALRLLERQMHDRDPRIASDAAMRVSNFVRSTDALPAAPAQTPEEVRAAIRAGLESAEGCALVVDVAETIGPLKSGCARQGGRRRARCALA